MIRCVLWILDYSRSIWLFSGVKQPPLHVNTHLINKYTKVCCKHTYRSPFCFGRFLYQNRFDKGWESSSIFISGITIEDKIEKKRTLHWPMHLMIESKYRPPTPIDSNDKIPQQSNEKEFVGDWKGKYIFWLKSFGSIMQTTMKCSCGQATFVARSNCCSLLAHSIDQAALWRPQVPSFVVTGRYFTKMHILNIIAELNHVSSGAVMTSFSVTRRDDPSTRDHVMIVNVHDHKQPLPQDTIVPTPPMDSLEFSRNPRYRKYSRRVLPFRRHSSPARSRNLQSPKSIKNLLLNNNHQNQDFVSFPRSDDWEFMDDVDILSTDTNSKLAGMYSVAEYEKLLTAVQVHCNRGRPCWCKRYIVASWRPYPVNFKIWEISKKQSDHVLVILHVFLANLVILYRKEIFSGETRQATWCNERYFLSRYCCVYVGCYKNNIVRLVLYQSLQNRRVSRGSAQPSTIK